MAITQTQRDAVERTQSASGSYIDSAGGVASITLGFEPRKIEVVNETARVTWEWYYGQTSAHGIATAADGVRTLATSGLITVTGNRKFGFTAVIAEQYRWRAYS